MTILELKSYLKLLGFTHDAAMYSGGNLADGDTAITILPTYNAIRLDNYIKRRNLFMSLDNPNFMERLGNFIDYEGLVLKKNNHS